MPIGALLGAAWLLAGCGGHSHPAASPPTTPTTAATATSQTDLTDRLVATGINQAQSREFAQAQITFQDVLTIDPTNLYAWYNLGLIAQTENDPSRAIVDYQHALKTDPEYTPAMYNEAIALEPTQRQEALSLYKQIVAINPKAATAYLRMSLLYAQMGDKAEAASARAKAIALEPQLGSVTPPTT